MRALIRMDWTLNRRLLLQLSPLIAFWFSLAFAHGLQGLLAVSFMSAALAMLVPVFQNSGESIEPFLLVLPVSRSQIVTARYLASLMGLGLALLVSGSFGLAGHGLGFSWAQQLRPNDLASGLGSQGFLLAGILFLFLPFHFRFGGELASGIFVGTLAVSLAPMLVAWGFSGTLARLMTLLDRAPDGGFLLTRGAAGLALLGAASLAVSLPAYRRRGLQSGTSVVLPILPVLVVAGALALALR